VRYLVSEFKPTPASRKFDKIKPECKLSGKFLVFHSNILISFKLLNLGRQHPKMFGKKAVKFYNYLGSQLFYINNDK